MNGPPATLIIPTAESSGRWCCDGTGHWRWSGRLGAAYRPAADAFELDVSLLILFDYLSAAGWYGTQVNSRWPILPSLAPVVLWNTLNISTRRGLQSWSARPWWSGHFSRFMWCTLYRLPADTRLSYVRNCFGVDFLEWHCLEPYWLDWDDDDDAQIQTTMCRPPANTSCLVQFFVIPLHLATSKWLPTSVGQLPCYSRRFF
jgi:hypothetical protein